MTTTKTAGIILAGGQSRRMGTNKALLPYPDGEISATNALSFLTRLSSVLLEVCNEVVLVARDDEQVAGYRSYVSERVRCVVDRTDLHSSPGLKMGVESKKQDRCELLYRGPLIGLYSGLSAIRDSHAFVVAVDMPFVTREMVAFLQGKIGEEPIVLPMVDGAPQVLCAMYARSLLPIVAEMLQEGERGPRALLRSVEVKVVGEDLLREVEPDLRSFRNINTPGDFERVMRIS